MENKSKNLSARLFQLGRKLGLTVWKNQLVLPEINQKHSPLEIRLERKLKFTFIRGDRENKPTRIFISEQTDLLGLCRYLPFISPRYQLFLCNEHLIRERLGVIEQNEMFQDDNLATKQLNYLLEKAARSGASDIHLESLAEEKQARIRVDGKLQRVNPEEQIKENLFSKIKLVSGMDIAQKRVPQDGHFPYISDRGERFDLRTSTVPGVSGEKIVIRLLPAHSVKFSLQGLDFNRLHINILKKSISAKSGMILFTGPTGSGKTTSLYAILNELASESLNIITVEDPVEYRVAGITQVEVNELAGVSFSSALRSFLRQDPDVILVGEIRDPETAQIAARAAQTGHMVLSTLHSNNVFEAVHRLKNLGVKGDDLASSLKLLISQRLLSRLCSCRNDPDCPRCSGAGSLGRTSVMEILEITPDIRKALSYEANIAEIEKLALEQNFIPMRRFGETLAQEGVVSLSELDSVCPADL